MRTVKYTEVDKDSETVIIGYILGNITNISDVAKLLSKTEGRKINRQSAVNLIANVLPGWYKIGKIDIGNSANKVGEL